MVIVTFQFVAHWPPCSLLTPMDRLLFAWGLLSPNTGFVGGERRDEAGREVGLVLSLHGSVS